MKISRGEKAFNILNILFMMFLVVVTLYPYMNQLAVSLNDAQNSALGGITIYPRVFTMHNYTIIFSNYDFKVSVFISAARVVIGSLLGLAVTTGAAYALAKKNLPGKNMFVTFLLIPMFISGGLIPTLILFRYMGLINNFLVYILPSAFIFFYMVIMRTYMQTIPDSIEESAVIDGANDVQILYKIMIPLSMPVMATVILWLAVGHWNDWTTSLYFITKRRLFTEQYVLYKIVKEAEIVNELMTLNARIGGNNAAARTTITSESVKAATVIVATLPIVMLYPFLQKYFIKGVTVGALKE